MGSNTSLNGIDLYGEELYITTSTYTGSNNEILAVTRINIDYAEGYKNKLWRFFLNRNQFVSQGYKK
jgi:DNA-3-methyladenine glycosylase